MPNAAISTGVVDLINSPKAIAENIIGYIHSKDKTFKAIKQEDTRSTLEKIFTQILNHTGYDFSGYKLKTIHRRIARRMSVHGIHTLEAYLALLSRSKPEVESLFKDFLISVTAFFRDPEAFEDLKNVVDLLVDRVPESEAIRVWVPGCANGEEAYSIAIMLQQALVEKRRSTPFQVFASDIDEFALGQARRGLFSQTQLEGVSEEIRTTFFKACDGQYLISKSIREKVVFAKQNLITDPPFSKVDLISCRNLLIYFTAEWQRRVIQTFHFALRPKGFLFLGKSESVPNFTPKLFDAYLARSQIYMRHNIDLSKRMDQIQSANSYARELKKPTFELAKSERRTLAHQLETVLLNEVVPASIIVDASGQVLHIRGSMERYLTFPQGRIDTNVLSLAADDLKVDMRSLLARAREKGFATGQSLFYSGENQEILLISIRRFDLEEVSGENFLISFLPAKVDEGFFVNPEMIAQHKREANELLLNEVALFKERLKISVEELETTNEELQSTNEELQSANEELQSTNEELQTANEELQSTNEELSTVNQELEVKSFELEQLNGDLEHMLENMNELIVVLDTRLRVVRYTQKASEVFGLTREMISQTFTTVGFPVDIPNLRNELLNVIDFQEEQQIKARFQSEVFTVRLVPYKQTTNQMSGILMFFEPHSGRNLPDSDRSGVQTFELLGNECAFAMGLVDSNGCLVYANDKLYQLLASDEQTLRYQSIRQLIPEPYCNHFEEYLKSAVIEENEALLKQWREITLKTPDHQRILIKAMALPTWMNGQKHFIVRITEHRGSQEGDV